MITNVFPNTWKDLQNVVGEILKNCGFSVEIEKKVETVRGQVELDVYAEEVIDGRKYTIICECKYWKKNIPQNVIHAFRSIVLDLGCDVGYIITSSSFQKGAIIASKFTNIRLLTWPGFQNCFLESWYKNYYCVQVFICLLPLRNYLNEIFSISHEFADENYKNEYLCLSDDFRTFDKYMTNQTIYLKHSFQIPVLPISNDRNISDTEKTKLPICILNETSFRELLEICIEYVKSGVEKYEELAHKYK